MGFLQIEVAEESRYLTAMITPLGLSQWKRVPFALSSAPNAFQKIIRNIIQDCDCSTNLFDDSAVCGLNKEEHDQRLEKLLAQLSKFNPTINDDK